MQANKGLFYAVYVGIAGFNMCRDVIQVSYRCRSLESNVIKAFFFDQNNTNHTFKNDDALMDHCPIYTNMVKDILIEKQAPLKGAFHLFTQKAHYTFETDDNIISEDVRKHIDKLYEETVDIGYTYESIPTYNYNQIQKIQQKLYSQSATLENKMAVMKYHFRLRFAPDADENMVAKSFDGRYSSFFDYMNWMHHQNDDNILLKISKNNNWINIIPDNEELNKVKLSEELVNDINEDFHFSQLSTKTKKHGLLYKNVVNCSFGKHVITSEKKGTNYSLKISETHRDNFNFGLTSLKCYQIKDTCELSDIEASSSQIKLLREKNRIALDENLAVLDI
jgi:hypothetical protein